ncbi:MAG: rod shape-determining protein MreD [Bacteroidales bacterium]|nr:rod shape-determining protein MreD [Bacteroidales bacterium]
MNRPIHYILMFVLFCLLQTFVFGRMQLGHFFYPCIYVLFILLFPFGYKTLYLLLWSFAIGLCVDMLSAGVWGLHTSASLFLGLSRQSILKLVASKEEFGQLMVPGLRTLGYQRYFTFLMIALFIHHSVLFGLETFRFSYFPLTLLRVLCSALLNSLLILLAQVAFLNQKRHSGN